MQVEGGSRLTRLAEQIDILNTNPEDQDPMLKDMLSTLKEHLT